MDAARIPLSDMRNKINQLANVSADGVAIQRELSRAERLALDFSSLPPDILAFKRYRKLTMNRTNAEFLIAFISVMVTSKENNVWTKLEDQRVVDRLLETKIIPYVCENRIWALDESTYPIKMDSYHTLESIVEGSEITKSAKWKLVKNYYEEIKLVSREFAC